MQPAPDFTISNATQCVKGNSFSFTNTSNNSTSYQWSFGDNTSSTTTSPSHTYPNAGTYNVKLVAINSNGCKDSVTKVITVNPSPDLGADKSITVSCASGTTDITGLYNTSGYSSVTYNTANPQQAPVGTHRLIVANGSGCTDTAFITVLDASTVTVPTTPNASRLASRECTDATGWTHYYNDNGTPSDYNDDIRLFSIKKNGNNIGTVGDGTFQVKVAATAAAGTNRAVKVTSPFVQSGTSFYSMNRYWDITPTQQPATAVNVRFYYNTQDLSDVNGDYPGGGISHQELKMYKLNGGNPDPTTNWSGASSVNYYNNDASPSLIAWQYTDIGNNRHQAEFAVNNFSGGGAGAISFTPLPVTLVQFDVASEGDKVKLTWSTATEVNSKVFEIQRSIDGRTFTTLGNIAAAGNSTLLRNYRFDDANITQYTGQVLYYRLLLTDLNGQQRYSDVKSVRIDKVRNMLSLQFNPVRNEAVLNYISQREEKVTIRITDAAGRTIMQIQQTALAGANQFRLSSAKLAQGIYSVELLTHAERHVLRMLKE